MKIFLQLWVKHTPEVRERVAFLGLCCVDMWHPSEQSTPAWGFLDEEGGNKVGDLLLFLFLAIAATPTQE